MTQPAQRYRGRFESMLAELRAHPQLTVLKAELRPPCDPADLAWAAEQYGLPVPAAAAALYAEMNGAEIEWRHVDPRREQGGAYGHILLFDVRTTFRKDWEGDAYGCKRYRPFDWPLDEHYAGLGLEYPDEVFWVYDTTRDARYLGSFEQYLEALLAMRGLFCWQDRFLASTEAATPTSLAALLAQVGVAP